MEGYMEKLPINKKKATLLKTWKRRYFKAQDGYLYYYEVGNDILKFDMSIFLVFLCAYIYSLKCIDVKIYAKLKKMLYSPVYVKFEYPLLICTQILDIYNPLALDTI